MFWVFATQPHAATAENVIVKLGGRALHHLGYERDADDYPRGRRVVSRQTNGPVVNHWDTPRQTNAGTYAIRSPQDEALYSASLSDKPATLAIGYGIDPDAVTWAPVVAAANLHGAGLNPLTFDADVEVTMSGAAWIHGALALVGITYTASEWPGFPEDATP